MRRLMLMGGGPRPPEAVARFVDWSGEADAKVLVIGWASEEPSAATAGLERDFRDAGAGSVAFSLAPPSALRERAGFLSSLAEATGVFFSGGDQNLVMDALHLDPWLGSALRERHFLGVPFGGTSAGTAIMSESMFAGDAAPDALDPLSVRLRPGLGLLEGALLDQHFLRRRRQNRLFGAILGDYAPIGLGIDEGAALAVSDGRLAEVIGPERVMYVVRAARGGELKVGLIGAGAEYDLRRRCWSPMLRSDRREELAIPE